MSKWRNYQRKVRALVYRDHLMERDVFPFKRSDALRKARVTAAAYLFGRLFGVDRSADPVRLTGLAPLPTMEGLSAFLEREAARVEPEPVLFLTARQARDYGIK